MDSAANSSIPNRAETLKVLRFMGEREPILLLRGDADGFGARWTVQGQEVQPAIATWLTKAGYITDAGATEMGARILNLTEAGREFRTNGLNWWSELSLLAKLKVIVFG